MGKRLMSKKNMKKLFSAVAYLSALLALVFVFAEVILRVSINRESKPARDFLQGLSVRVCRHWLNLNQTDPFVPPLLVYADRDIADEARLKKIYESTRLPSSKTWTSYDFLQDEARKNITAYTIHSNSLGFRGKERAIEKNKSQVRIIALGTYQTFGHGVEDNETYAARLEELLNRSGKGREFQVWNGGRHASTAIIGLARLKNEIFNYKPDLLIFDYGMVDLSVWDDNFHPVSLRLPDSPGYTAVKKCLRPLVPLLWKSYVVNRLVGKINLRVRQLRVSQFISTMNELIRVSREHHVPVIVIRQLTVKLPAEIYAGFAKENVHFVDVWSVFKNEPPDKYTLTNPDKRSDFLYEGRDFWEKMPYTPYRLNYFQLNAHGHRVLANALAAEVKTIIK